MFRQGDATYTHLIRICDHDDPDDSSACSSKLGDLELIHHGLRALDDGAFGRVAQFYRWDRKTKVRGGGEVTRYLIANRTYKSNSAKTFSIAWGAYLKDHSYRKPDDHDFEMWLDKQRARIARQDAELAKQAKASGGQALQAEKTFNQKYQRQRSSSPPASRASSSPQRPARAQTSPPRQTLAVSGTPKTSKPIKEKGSAK